MQRLGAVLAVLGLLAGCEVAPQRQMPVQVPRDAMQTGGNLPPRQAAQNFVAAVVAVEPVAEAYCRARTQGVPCDFQIVVDDRQDQPPNAFQTVDRQGRPVIGFTLALIADARNVDEIAFVLGHETAHHILGHLPRQQQSATTGAVLAGVLVALGGGSSNAVQSAQEMGA
ncbi:MAG: M48 family metalloprotease, partial [Paracoccaceae bacterium]|nr:M48 family metalloprotease [Paracoccaceae bacterium]